MYIAANLKDLPFWRARPRVFPVYPDSNLESYPGGPIYALLGGFYPIAHFPCLSLGLDTNCVLYRSTRFSAAPPLTKDISIYCFHLSGPFSALVASPSALHLDPVRRPVWLWISYPERQHCGLWLTHNLFTGRHVLLQLCETVRTLYALFFPPWCPLCPFLFRSQLHLWIPA